MQGWTFTREDWEEEMDKVKAIVAESLVDAKLADAIKTDKWCASHTVLIRKASIFRKLIRGTGKKEEKYRYIVVKKKAVF